MVNSLPASLFLGELNKRVGELYVGCFLREPNLSTRIKIYVLADGYVNSSFYF